MSQCGKGSEKDRRECAKTAEQRRDECVETRDDGYNECTQTREDRQKKCCTWIPCKWACKAFHWLVSIVCIAWHWVENIVCVTWHTIVEVVCVAWKALPVLLCHLIDALSSLVAFIVSLIEAALNWIWSLVGFFVDILLMIPFVGRLLNWLFQAAKTIFNAVISAPDMALTLLGIMPEKKLRLGVIVLRDRRGTPIARDDLIVRAIQCAINIYREQCNIRIIPVRYAQYQMAFDDPEDADGSYIFHDDGVSDDYILDVCCTACAVGADLGNVGAQYQALMAMHTFWGNGRRLLGYGAPVIAFTVRSFTGTPVGCSIGPLVDYVTVQFADSQQGTPATELTSIIRLGRISSLAHEVCHACNVVWHEDGNENLMSRLPNGDRFCRLNRFQKMLVRASRHVTYA